MAHELFSPEWVDAWRAEIRASEEYRRAASRWKWPLMLIVRPDPSRGFVVERRVYLDLFHGECREACLVHQDDAPRADFILSATAGNWMEVLGGRLDPVGGIALGKLHLDRGSLLTLAMNTGAARALVATAVRVPGEPPRRKSGRGTPAAVPGDVAREDAAPPPPAFAPAFARQLAFASTSPGGLRTDILPMRLWRKAKRLGVWDPDEIDFTRDREHWKALAPDERDLLLRLTALFLAGEEGVTLDLLPLVMTIAREGRLEEQIYLTSFLWEEAKHVDFFHTAFLRGVAGDPGDLGRYHTGAYRRIFYDELPRAMRALLEDPSPGAQVRAVATYNMIVEGVLAETGYQGYLKALEASDLMPGLREGIGYLQRDESRHVAYGVFLLSRLIAANDALWDAAEARMNELFPLALELIGEAFEPYEVIPFGIHLSEFIDIATTNFNRRMLRIERARGQTLAEVLAWEGADA